MRVKGLRKPALTPGKTQRARCDWGEIKPLESWKCRAKRVFDRIEPVPVSLSKIEKA
jgi:hypothetical protein